ncbi:type I-E CRISPR-associated protein Cse2/CasB [Corynebacterium sp. CNCTC7651]|uniref:type I-E CRISPR-associated protein Cse2/CasB n=1 Tax=Corynebacterium sp. CNCTC7651 TaxID=2815361 RepID=UPI001F444850|nr:type I-E CRISPR-associated protein Cse2/CasB [Corynebacterium sp. CNCTC7651]UIZ92560.1 type I-E CRISPR-associated protein Cse2/CasB [Corynebacterium sp. CNCTC7651]
MTQPSVPPSGAPLCKSVARTADKLQRDYLDNPYGRDAADARAALAELRKASALEPAKNPMGLQKIIGMLNPPLNEDFMGHDDRLSASEVALYRSLSLFGVHMQSAKKPMHTSEVSFAQACGQLMPRTESKSFKHRFDALQLATDDASRAVHLRSLVSLLRNYELAFDYGRFSEDLRALANPNRKPGVLLRWGRDFARGARQLQDAPPPEDVDTTTNTN